MSPSWIQSLIKESGQEIPKYIVVDVETSAYMVGADWESAPRALKFPHKTPEIIALGALENGTGSIAERYQPMYGRTMSRVRCPTPDTVMVGHNIGFDYQHLRPVAWQLVWDTMIADYVLSAQRNKFSSLGELMARECGLPPKKDLIGESMAIGIPPQDIPKEKLTAYLRGDVEGTEAVFLAQWVRSTIRQRRLIVVLSRASLAYADCSANGLILDVGTAIRRRDACFEETERMGEGFAEVWKVGNPAQADGLKHVSSTCVRKGNAPTHWATTPTAMSSLLYNRPLHYTPGKVPAPDLGARRVRDLTVMSPLATVAPQVLPPQGDGIKSFLSTADDMLGKIITNGQEPHASLARMEQRRRENHKLGTTYYQPLLEQADKYSGRVHPRIHAVSTNTGRTSSSAPNIQNQPPATREVFISAPGTQFIEFDFQQLEIWALAVLSGCPDLRAALIRGDDIHYLTGVKAGLWTDTAGMTKEGRRLVKRINFGLIYGGQGPGLAAQSGAPLNKVRDIINGFYKQFPGVKRYHTDLLNWADTGKRGSLGDFFDSRIEVVRMGEVGTVTDIVITTATGREYVFEKQQRYTREQCSPTKLKNYPVQGFGTGDFVQLMLACLWHTISAKEWGAVVHDAALLSTPHSDRHARTTRIQQALAEALEALNELWGIRVDVPINLSFEYKDRWSPMEGEDDAKPGAEEAA